MRKKMTTTDLVHETTALADVFGRENGVKVTFSGDGYYTDGETVNFPALDLNADITFDLTRCVRGGNDHEAGGHLRFSDMPLIMKTYEEWAKAGRQTLKYIHNSLEDVWIESKTTDLYPGSFKNLQHLEEKLKEEGLTYYKENDVDLSQTDKTSICASIKTNTPMFNIEGSHHRALWNELNPTVQAHSNRWIKECVAAKDSAELIRLAKAIYKLILEDPELKSDPEDFDPASGDSFDDSAEGSETIDQEVEAGLASGEPKEGEGTSEGELVEAEVGKGTPEGEMTALINKMFEETNGPVSNSYIPYSTEYDSVYNRKKEGREKQFNELFKLTDPSDYLKLKSSLQSEVTVMKTKLKRALMTRCRTDWKRDREVGTLDTSRLVKGFLGSPSIYKSKVETFNVDTAITLMVDLSGSMGGGKMRSAADCTIAMAECFEGTGFKYRIMGFTNGDDIPGANDLKFHRIETLETLVFKDFNDSLRVSRPFLGQLPRLASYNNSDYDFLCNELSVLKKREEKRKVLIVLSDGMPSHIGSHEHGTNFEVPFMRKAVKEHRTKYGIETLGIGLQDSTVQSIYDDSIVVNSVSDLSSKSFGKLTKILLGGQN